jgi:hypothetical protein
MKTNNSSFDDRVEDLKRQGAVLANVKQLCVMDSEMFDLNRRTRSMGIRVYEDQLEALRHLKIRKHQNRLKIADLIREAIDQYIERENQTQAQ